MRALGFCVSVAHARYMARVFNEAEIPAQSVTGGTHQNDREEALRALRDRRVNILFTADLFNEGLDLPSVDTVLFLRPTESATIFLQQLGRGLRLAQDKPVLTVLDFVGHQRQEFRFDMRYQALTGATRRGLAHQVEQGFPFLPSGSQIILDRHTQQLVLANIKNQLTNRWPSLVSVLRTYGDIDLAGFLQESSVELGDVVRANRSWTRLRRDAGLPTRDGDSREEALLKRIRSLGHVDDKDRAVTYRALLADGAGAYAELSPAEQGFARMLLFSLWPGSGFESYDAGLASLRSEPAVRDELRSVIDVTLDQARHVMVEPQDRLAGLNLRIRARYQREEILAALGHASLTRVPSVFREGVLRATQWNADAFLITLKKSDTDFSPSTMYRDYAISPDLFHWESQSTTSVDSPTGQRYLHHGVLGSSILLFVRDGKTNEMGTEPYMFLGPAAYVSHTGDRPIAITWRLDHPMPLDVFTAARVAAG